MKSKLIGALFFTHLITVSFGVALGIYLLPILTAPPAPKPSAITRISSQSSYIALISPTLKGSDLFHWGEGEFSLSPDAITLSGKLSPGPDFKLYLSPQFVESEEDFLQVKPTMLLVGEVKTFNNFITTSTQNLDLESYNTVIVWCESFGEFITAAKYR
jgi:hypothetical protein